MKKIYLYIIVSISGASVLALEILGTRILGPYYGVSLFLWSALITVTLAALSLGYAVGGRYADKGATLPRLCIMLAIAGVWILFIPLLKNPIVSLAHPLGLRFAVLLAAFFLFFIPLTLLGMVSPYAIKLKAKKLAEVGRSAGNLYAISTLASVVSALLTGFFLIPYVGVTKFTFIIGLLLLLTAIFVLLIHKGWIKTSLIIILLSIICFIFVNNMISKNHKLNEDVEFIKQSPYGEIRVLDYRGLRYLLIDGAVHSVVDTTNWMSHHRHVVAMDINKYLFEKPGKMLLIGLGAGSIAKNFAMEGWKVDAVEIDPVVINAAKNYFNLQSKECEIFTQDGRQFLLTHDTKYDLIIMDAFGSSSIPFHLITDESFALIASRLTNNGVFALNVEAIGWRHKLIKSTAVTLERQFQNVIALPLHEPPNILGNVILVASNKPLEFDEDWLGHPADYVEFDPYEHWVVVQRNHAWDNRFVPDTKNIRPLTDDLNPVDIWAEEINLAARKDLFEYFGKD